MMNLKSNEDVATAADLRTEQLAALSHHLIKCAETDKAGLARELHDELGACLTVITMDISVVAEKLKQTEPELALRLQRAIATIKNAVTLKRRIIEELRPSMLDSLGLSACLTEHVLEFEKRAGLQVTADICEDFDHIEPDSAIGIFRIVQESLSNIERHAGASRIRLSLQAQEGGAYLLIEDNGVGIAPDVLVRPASCGLSGMRERMISLGGQLTVRGADQGSGTTVEARLPLAR